MIIKEYIYVYNYKILIEMKKCLKKILKVIKKRIKYFIYYY